MQQESPFVAIALMAVALFMLFAVMKLDTIDADLRSIDRHLSAISHLRAA